MTSRTKMWLLTGSLAFMLLAAVYCGLGVIQAACLFTGERATRNVQFWGTLGSVALICALVFAILAIWMSIRAKRHVGGR